MEINAYIHKYNDLKYNFFKWRYELNIAYKLSLSVSFAIMTGLLAQLRLYIPGTPVPVTGQVFGVFLAGVLLGSWGGVSQLMYIGLGAIGVPWFAGFNSGILYVMGPTCGYLIGFVIASFFIGSVVDRYVKSRGFFNILLIMLFSTFVLIYLPGIIYFYFWSGASIGLYTLISICVIPFIFVDIVKASSVAILSAIVLPKKSYTQELCVRYKF
jgi:biotin transport system substrate-specific component